MVNCPRHTAINQSIGNARILGHPVEDGGLVGEQSLGAGHLSDLALVQHQHPVAVHDRVQPASRRTLVQFGTLGSGS